MMGYKAGQVVIEVLIGVAIATIALLALVQISTRSVSNSGFAKRQAVGTGYAIEGMEWIKGRRKLDAWELLYARNGTFCLGTLPASLANLPGSCSVITGTEYTRTVTFTPSVVTPPPEGNQQSNVTVLVTWWEGSRQVNARQETYFLR